MFLRYKTHEGRYNLMNPSEVSYSCNVAVYDEDANKIKNCNFTPEYEMNGSDVDEILAEITESLHRYWSSSDDRKDMVAFLQENQHEIETGNRKRRLAEIDTEISALEEERELLNKEGN